MTKTFTLLLILALAALPGMSQSGGKSGAALILTETSFDFGKIPQGRPVTHNFEIKNNGKQPLILENVEASCGCTTPEWSQSPVAPGKTSVIKVGFNAGAEGQFSKTITITYNSGQVTTLAITGNVYGVPATSAPLNTSLSILN